MLNEIKFALTIALFLTERKRLQDRENRTSIMVCIHRTQVPEKVDFIEKRHFPSVVALKKNKKLIPFRFFLQLFLLETKVTSGIT